MKEATNIIKKYNRTSLQPPSASQTTETSTKPAMQNTAGNESEKLLQSILEQLKNMQRNNMFSEFSITRFIAGIVQIIVLACLLTSIYFLMSPTRQDNAVLISLGFAAVLQVMALTLYIMQRPK